MLAIELTGTAYTGFRTQKLRQNQHFFHAIAQKAPFQAGFAGAVMPGSAPGESPSAGTYWHNPPGGTGIFSDLGRSAGVN
jgi:hypothetical protein